ncbi:hypothetical protein HMPREF0523_0694 [Lactobacillus iners UPII 60-B]|nr:hypothetical protein HMPREF9216_0062 [Lactobacillus iners LEAF 2053A-b]EGC81166.1 hypothetical protein HMPREF0523_0694 [Lactobacillus iners UPII 60-B]
MKNHDKLQKILANNNALDFKFIKDGEENRMIKYCNYSSC